MDTSIVAVLIRVSVTMAIAINGVSNPLFYCILI